MMLVCLSGCGGIERPSCVAKRPRCLPQLVCGDYNMLSLNGSMDGSVFQCHCIELLCCTSFPAGAACTGAAQLPFVSPSRPPPLGATPCDGPLHDNVLDWDSPLPEDELDACIEAACDAVSLGTDTV
jgi:hypothetical protein